MVDEGPSLGAVLGRVGGKGVRWMWIFDAMGGLIVVSGMWEVELWSQEVG